MIPLGVTFLAVTLLACLIAVANARSITAEREPDHEDDWQWPERRQ